MATARAPTIEAPQQHTMDGLDIFARDREAAIEAYRHDDTVRS